MFCTYAPVAHLLVSDSEKLHVHVHHLVVQPGQWPKALPPHHTTRHTRHAHTMHITRRKKPAQMRVTCKGC